MVNTSSSIDSSLEGIAIVGMSGRFPGAKTPQDFWQNIAGKVESISSFTDEELEESGIDSALFHDPDYVRAAGVLDDVEFFDAAFFDYSPREASLLDPQQRLFLECAWEALEDAGYDPHTYTSSIGIYAGSSMNNYLLNNISSNRELMDLVGSYHIRLSNDKDFLPTRVSYKLNLKGPSVNVQTSCSTSLVAVHIACQGLLNYQCDMALAGGVAINIPHKAGYLYQVGGIGSPDGHCRAFDADAKGTVGSSGLGIVVLKRLEDAVADGDCIYAVIKATAINNDGSDKVGYTAPSIDGQAQAVGMALALADVEPETINYIETHGTGTALGDPIEISALTSVFQQYTDKTGFCAIGSAKTNVGHMDVAAGVAGLIKVSLALKHQLLPPSINYEQPNPEIDFDNSPFFVNTHLTPWPVQDSPRRAGVSSFGIGGTNAHVVLEEPPERTLPSKTPRPFQLLLLSAKSSSALDAMTQNLATYLQEHPQASLPDVAYTLQVGRTRFEHRRYLICNTVDQGVQRLSNLDAPQLVTHHAEASDLGVVFMFPGQGSQYVNMAQELYQTEPRFRDTVDYCAQLLQPSLKLDIRQILYPDDSLTSDAAAQQLRQTAMAQPALFVIEYALARLWMDWGIIPEAMIGHSLGEYVVACLAGVMSLDDALRLVTVRAALMQQQPAGSMVAVSITPQALEPMIDAPLALAAVNAPELCVVSGPTEAVDQLIEKLEYQGIDTTRLHTSHAFHSAMMDPVAKALVEQFRSVQLQPPTIPFISTATGTWITDDQATSAEYWGNHLRHTVRFSEGLDCLVQEERELALLEVGPGVALTRLARRHPICGEQREQQAIFASLRHPQSSQSESECLLTTLGNLWAVGVSVDWSGVYKDEYRHRLSLPSYPFERQRYWIDPQSLNQSVQPTQLLSSVLVAGQLQSQVGIQEFDHPSYRQKIQSIDWLCIAYIRRALDSLGISVDASRLLSLDEVVAKAGVLPQYGQFLGRLMNAVSIERKMPQGLDDEQCSLLRDVDVQSLESINQLVTRLQHQWEEASQFIDLMQRTGECLATVLTGETNLLELLFPGGSLDAIASIYKDSSTQYLSNITFACLKQIVRTLPKTIKLRVLEIGGGTGTYTRTLLPALPPEQTSYVFTDIGPLFVNQAQQKFSDYQFIEYRTLNIEKSPEGQGFELASFDIIIAGNVLHATRDLTTTLTHVQSLLAPGGILLLIEPTTPEVLSFELPFGALLPEFEDIGQRGGHPFITRQQWQDWLRQTGFSEVETIPESASLYEHLIVAQTPSTQASLFERAFHTEQPQPDSVSPALSDKKKNIAEWFYAPVWKQSFVPKPLQSEEQRTQSNNLLVFLDDSEFGHRFADELSQQGIRVTTVGIGSTFSKIEASRYVLNPTSKDDYGRLIDDLVMNQSVPDTVVHLWNLTSTDSEKTQREQGFYSLLFLVQAMSSRLVDDLKLTLITDSTQSVTGTENIEPGQSFATGLTKVIAQEYTNIRCCHIDIERSNTQIELSTTVQNLISEIGLDRIDETIAYRGQQRWIQSFEAVELAASEKPRVNLRSEGIYLLTSGLNGITKSLATHLALNWQAKLAIIEPTSFPHRDDWQSWLQAHGEENETSQEIRSLQAIKEIASDVLIFNIDLRDEAEMQAVIQQTAAQFGEINGVFYTSAISEDEPFNSIQEITQADYERYFQQKGQGLSVLQRVLQGQTLDFCLLSSSLSAIVGGIGMASHVVTNTFVDAVARHQRQLGTVPFTSVNWDGWRLEPVDDQVAMLGAKLADFEMAEEEWIAALERILSFQPGHQLIVSTGDLHFRLEQSRSQNSEGATQGSSKRDGFLHARPALNTDYVEPSNEIEKKLAGIWQRILGIEAIGICDNFFDLGGDSLLAIQLLSQIRQNFPVELPLQQLLFDHSNIEKLAIAIEQALLQNLEQMSDEEAKELLSML
ncbi:MAG: beta-ketoacyl synthase N-terminal-like domain-containing protein [Cyanobacteria bacterium P01_F01_bin.150]